MKELIGKKILKIEIDRKSQHYLKFITDSGELLYFAEGDCCSESWFYGFNGVKSLIESIITSAEEISLGEALSYKGRQEFTRVYCYKLISTGGHTDIEFRNSSNGYYGGWVNFCGNLSDIYGDKKKQNLHFRRELRKVVWLEIKNDITF